MANNIGTAYFKLAPDLSGVQSKISAGMKGAGAQATRDLGAEVEKESGGFQGAIGKLGGIAKTGGLAIAGGLAAGAVGMTALVGKMLTSGGELEQQLGGAEAVFGEFSEGIKDQATTAYFQMGLSQNEFLQGANKMGSLFQGAGFDVKSSMDMSAEAIQRATDVASIMGLDTATALESVTGMAKGNFTMMDNLGVAINDTSIQQYALSKGITKSTQAMSTQEKVGLANQLFMEKTAKYAGNYQKENQSLAGSLNSTKKGFEDLMSGSGDVEGFLELLINTIELAMPRIIDLLPKIVDGISQVLSAVIPAIAKVIPTLVPAVIGAVVALQTAIIAELPGIIKLIVEALPMLIDAFIEIFLGLVKALPEIVTILANAIPMVVDALVNGLTNPEALSAIIMGAVQLFLAIVKALPIIIVSLVNALPIIIDNIIKTITSTEFIMLMMGATVELFMAIVKAIPQIAIAIGKALYQIYLTFKDVLSYEGIQRIGGDMVRGLWAGINDQAGWIMGKIKGFGEGLLSGIKNFFGIHSPSTVFAGIGENLNKGLAQGLESSAGLVTGAMDAITNDALSSVLDPTVAASLALASPSSSSMVPAASQQSTSSQEVSIGTVVLGDQSAVREFFKQLNQDTINVGMGMTPAQGMTI